ncbi:hypothetical protein ACIQ9P_01085 [Kitasatospora sp. NPDC094019]|uniref:hypothetical protein n=1 Tax=Kitasatospora sp. NPDC094019 TaxID=3364091 RepID=UPI00382BA1C1
MSTAERPLRNTELSAWTWIDSTPDGLASMVLVTPLGEGSPALGSLAERAGLLPPEAPMPTPDLRLVLHDSCAVVIMPRAETALRIPADAEWAAFVRRGGTVVVILGERPLEPGAGRAAVDRYLMDTIPPGRLWLGKTTLATAGHAPAQVRGGACVVCGLAGGVLEPVGYAYTPTSGAPLGWPVVAHAVCPAFKGGAMTGLPHQPGVRLTQAQREGRACVFCEGSSGLKEAGHVIDRGLGYAVKVCRSCRHAEPGR